MPRGNNQRRIFLPNEEFIYGKRNRTPTPIKDVVGYEYARNAESDIKVEYQDIIHQVKILNLTVLLLNRKWE